MPKQRLSDIHSEVERQLYHANRMDAEALGLIDDEPEDDVVNHPQHYTAGKVEVIDMIESAVIGLPPFDAYCVGNALKYIARHDKKNGTEDIRKSLWYLDRLIQSRTERGAL